MAKGWESKAVEDQVEQHLAKDPEQSRQPRTPAQMETHRRKEVLLLSRARVQKDLQSSHDQRYRDQLNLALADIESQLTALENLN
jgi:hypothetical protein